jgi:flavin reductase (DIM6/NTAB) family NADH-FMN oxidoreductase RutF
LKKTVTNLEMSYRYLYPRLTVLVSSGSVEEPNALAIAWSTPLSSNPPLLGVMITKKRFSYDIIRINKEFVINIPEISQVEGCFHIGSVSGRIEPGKLTRAGFNIEKSEKIDAPRIKECKINIECKLNRIIPTGDHDMFVGWVVNVVIDSEIIDDWSFDLNKFRPIYWRQSKNIKETFPLDLDYH